MRKILGLAVAALLVMGLVGGGTWAYFSDTETSTGNTFAVGTLDLEVDSDNPLASTLIDNSGSPMKPGDNLTATTISCDNVGSLPGDLYLRITSVSGNGGTALGPNGTSSEPEYVAEGGTFTGTTSNDNNTPDDDIDTVMVLYCQENGGAGFAGLDGEFMDDAETTSWVLIKNDLASSGSYSIDIGAMLASSTANEYQGDTVTFTIEFSLQQDGQTP